MRSLKLGISLMPKKKRREPETAYIDSSTHDGRGIAAIEGKKVFVSGALPGEKVEFIRRKSKKNFDEAELLKVIKPSNDRIEAKCEVFGRCGGCSLQHINEDYQRLIKEEALYNSLERIAKVKPKFNSNAPRYDEAIEISVHHTSGVSTRLGDVI